MRLDTPLPCHRCGYDLRGVPFGGTCPECRATVEDSCRVWLDWRRMVVRGCESAQAAAWAWFAVSPCLVLGALWPPLALLAILPAALHLLFFLHAADELLRPAPHGVMRSTSGIARVAVVTVAALAQVAAAAAIVLLVAAPVALLVRIVANGVVAAHLAPAMRAVDRVPPRLVTLAPYSIIIALVFELLVVAALLAITLPNGLEWREGLSIGAFAAAIECFAEAHLLVAARRTASEVRATFETSGDMPEVP